MHLFVKAIILGIVEGITEFLPISSTGHLILVNKVIEFTGDFAKMFDVVIQLGAILSVIVYFFRDLWPFSPNLPAERRREMFTLWQKTLLAVIPALVLGALFGDLIDEYLFTPMVVAITLFVGGVIILLVERRKAAVTMTSIHQLSHTLALAIGGMQCIAMIPGVSRSAATIIGAMLLGAARPVAAEFSFFLAIPTMIAASGYSLWKAGFNLSGMEWGALAIGFVVAFLTAWAVIALFMSYIRKHDFTLFGYYRVALAIVVFWLLS